MSNSAPVSVQMRLPVLHVLMTKFVHLTDKKYTHTHTKTQKNTNKKIHMHIFTCMHVLYMMPAGEFFQGFER